MKLSSNPIKTGSFGTVQERKQFLEKMTVKSILNIGMFATAFFILADFVPLYIKWTAVQTDNWYFVALLAAVSAVILDLPMFLAGRKISEYLDGVIPKQKMVFPVILAVTAFLIAYVPFFIFSLATKSATFEEALPLGSSTVINFDAPAVNSGSNPFSVIIAAVFSAVLPLGTSIASLVCGIVTYHPAKERLAKLEKVKILAQEHKGVLAWGKAQLSERKTALLMLRENDLLENHINEIKAQEQVRIQAYEEALEEALDADGILHVTENAFDQIENSDFNEDCDPEILTAFDDKVIEESKGMEVMPLKADFTNNDAV